MGEKRGAYRILVGRPEGKRPFGRPRPRWKDNIKMDIQDIGWAMDWIELAQVAGSCECDNELPGSIKCREFLD
jgi:hypothetical protein